MNHLELYHNTAFECGKLITQRYSTSFTLGIQTLDKKLHYPIYAIYAFVRYADEIVDTFHDYDKQSLLQRFKEDTYKAIAEGISLNPVLHGFQKVVRLYQIEDALIDAFLHSMEMDLSQSQHQQGSYQEYIYGSAEVVGLMCLRVFCDGNKEQYENLKAGARSLGAAFQKVNFLRDMRSDFVDRGRVYFPGVNFTEFTPEVKRRIEADIQNDFDQAYQAILQLPKSARAGVYLAYSYYLNLFRKIKKASTAKVLEERIRVPNSQKLAILVGTMFKQKLSMI